MAGSWSAVSIKRGQLDGEFTQSVGYQYTFTADAAAAAIPDKITEYVAGALVALRIVFDGDTPPDSLTYTIKDAAGVTIVTGTVTASGYVDLSLTGLAPFWIVPGPLTISCEGNTTNSAIASITMVFI